MHPDTGTLIREELLSDRRRKLAFCEVLSPLSPNGIPESKGFQGYVGIYIYAGHVAFFRKCVTFARIAPTVWETTGTPKAWETTGFIADLSWCTGCRVNMCLCFRDPAEYIVKLRFRRQPPPLFCCSLLATEQKLQWRHVESYSFI